MIGAIKKIIKIENLIKSELEMSIKIDTDDIVKFFEQLNNLAQGDNLYDISEYCIKYCQKYPYKKRYVVSNITGFLTSNYFNKIHNIDPSVLFIWGLQNKDWSDDIQASLFNPDAFKIVVENIVENVNNYLPANR